MSTTPRRSREYRWTICPGSAALLTVALLLLSQVGSRAAAPAAPPTPEEQARYLEWYKRQAAGKAAPVADPTPTRDDVSRLREWYAHNGAPQPIPIRTGETPADDSARFIEWYKRAGAPRPAETLPPPPTRADVVRFLAWYRRNGTPTPARGPASDERQPSNEDIARYLEAYRHAGLPVPHPLPVVTKLDVQPLEDHHLQTVAAQESPPVLVIPAPPLMTERPQPARLILVPPPPPRPLETPKETRIAAATPPPAAPLPPPPLPPALADTPSVPPAKPLPPLAAPPPATPTAEPSIVAPFDAILQQVGCSSCGAGGGLLGIHSPADGEPLPASTGPGCGCGSGGCVPGRLHQCSPCESDTVVGRFLCGLYDCICCPDPCYDPHWLPLADAAFFTESARPQTQQSVGWDAGRNLTNPDRAEYFWARADGKGQGPNPANHANPNGLLGERRVNYNDLWMYTEAALGNIGAFVYLPYRSLDGELVGHAAGFSDMQVGTKTLLFDCELLQIAFEFRTFIPVGNAPKGLGTGHVSLEPGLIVGLKVGPETYFQGQLEEWIPLGGDPDYQGAVLEYHTSLNQVLYRILPDVPLVGTAELSGWSFQHGQYTDPFAGPGQRATGGTYIAIGPGLRLFICDKIDFGIGMEFAVTDRHFADQLFRSEFRWRF